MAIPELTDDVKIIQALSTYPNRDDGLTEEEMKQKFDAAAVIIKEYLNGILVPAVQALQRALNNGEIIGIDDTLSKSGYAADAAVAGGRIGELEKLVKDAPLPIQNGGTGAATAAQALRNLGLTAAAAELNLMAGVTGNVQEQLDKKTPIGLVTTTIQGESQIETFYAKMAGNTSEIVGLLRSDGDSIGGGSSWMLLITNIDAMYGSIIAWQYGDGHVLMKTKSLYGGIWGDWRLVLTNDMFSYSDGVLTITMG